MTGWVVVGAVAIGLSLGLLGSGGSILTVPILSYLVGQPEKLAIASSLAVVGGISVLAMLRYVWQREIDWRGVFWFGLPGLLGTWIGASVAQYLPGGVQLLIFAIIMLVAAWRAIATAGVTTVHPATTKSKLRMCCVGLVVGGITGLVGVGGGFLIVPALIFFLNLPMRRAVGTSLAVIAINSLSGFVRYASALEAMSLKLDWQVIATFIVIGGAGSLLGGALGQRLPQQRLQQAFGAMLIVTALYMLVREIPKLP